MREAAKGVEPLLSNPTFVDLVAHRRFHTAVYMSSHNDLLISTLDALWDKADRYRRLGLEVVRSQEERDQKAREHAELLDAVIRGDSDGGRRRHAPPHRHEPGREGRQPPRCGHRTQPHAAVLTGTTSPVIPTEP